MRMPQSQVMRAWQRHTERQRAGIWQALSHRVGGTRRQVLQGWRRLAFHSRWVLLQVVFFRCLVFPVPLFSLFFSSLPFLYPACTSSCDLLRSPWFCCLCSALLLPVLYSLSSAHSDTEGGSTGKNVCRRCSSRGGLTRRRAAH
jgi:hypothetical protein